MVSSLKKVTKEKISSTFLRVTSHKQSDMNDDERQAQSIYNSVKEEASKDVKAIRALLEGNAKAANDFDGALIEASNFISREE